MRNTLLSFILTLTLLMCGCSGKNIDDEIKEKHREQQMFEKMVESIKRSEGTLDSIESTEYYKGTTKIHYRGKFLNRAKHGIWYEYNYDGTLIDTITYNKGKFISQTRDDGVADDCSSEENPNYAAEEKSREAMREYSRSREESATTYASDGQKCSQCFGHYSGGFCTQCGAASKERANESYSKAPNCEYCGGSGFVKVGGIHDRKKLCPSCKGKGKQIY